MWAETLELAQVLLIPALGYIIGMERRLTRMEAKMDMLIEEKHHEQTIATKAKERKV